MNTHLTPSFYVTLLPSIIVSTLICATIYRCVTGFVPTDAMERIQGDTIKAPDQLGMDIPLSGGRAIMRGLALKAVDRFENIQQLQQALATLDVPPPPPPPVRPLPPPLLPNVIECPKCGAKNQLNSGDDPNALRCEKCKKKLGEKPVSVDSSMRSEEDYFAQAFDELESVNKKIGLWAKVFSEAQGNESLAKASYLKIRSGQFANEYKQAWLEDEHRRHEEQRQQQIKVAEMERQRQEEERIKEEEPQQQIVEIERTRTFTSRILGAEFVLIPSGTFSMGSPAREKWHYDDETQHQVTISKPFYMQTTPVTQEQWQTVMGNTPSHFKHLYSNGGPVEQVSWNDVQEFIRKLNSMEGEDRYRLPTEAQWEYATRAGTTAMFNSGNSEEDLSRSGWYSGNSTKETHPVSQKTPNAWGLYDMHGNVWEWVQDCKADYPVDNATESERSSSGSLHVIRGGSWFSYAKDCRSACRDYKDPGDRDNRLGFRLLALSGDSDISRWQRAAPLRHHLPDQIEDNDLLSGEEHGNTSNSENSKTRRDGEFIADSMGMVLDTRTNLMWSGKDNDFGINWSEANSYCENYRGGCYTDWRMPTMDELEELYKIGNYENAIHITGWLVWASDRRGSDASHFNLNNGKRGWDSQSYAYGTRALPVRSGK